MPDKEKVIKGIEHCDFGCYGNCYEKECPYYQSNDCTNELKNDILALLKEQESVVHPESSCEMTYITNCCCDLCGVQLIREDNFCRCCGKRIEWES